VLNRKVHAYVTILKEAEEPKKTTDWHQFVGKLKDFPVFEGDPVEIQRAMRDEWG